jgi:hypothetical protein
MLTGRTIAIGIAIAILLGLMGGGLLKVEALFFFTSIALLTIGLVALIRPNLVGLGSRWVAASIMGLSLPCISFAFDGEHGSDAVGPWMLSAWMVAVASVASVRFLRRKASDTPVVHRSNASEPALDSEIGSI